MRLKDIEKQAILDAIEATKGHITLAAKRLGISRATMYRKLRLYQLKSGITQ